MKRILSQFESFSQRKKINNIKIIINDGEIVINSEILNFDIGIAIIASILCCGFIYVSENGFGYLLFGLVLFFCYITWNKLKYVNTVYIKLAEEEILIRPKLVHKERKIQFKEIFRFHIKYIETTPRYLNYMVHITTTDNDEVKLISFDNEEAAKDFTRLMNALVR